MRSLHMKTALSFAAAWHVGRSQAFSGVTSRATAAKCSSRSSRKHSPAPRASMGGEAPDPEWIPLAGDDEADAPPASAPVRKRILEEGEGALPTDGSTVELDYTGTLVGEQGWSVEDVAQCWLAELQGLNHLSPQFAEEEIDGEKLLNASLFTEEYCAEALGASNKIQAKKLVMASKRLIKQQAEYSAGSVFDASKARGKNYAFELGRGKVIRAMDLAASSMRVGERAEVVCRSDYAYGAEGLRTARGEVIVPPFAVLCFDLKLISAASTA